MSDDENEGEDQVTYQIVFDGDKAGKDYVYKHGKATATFVNTDVYTGDFQDGKRNGEGTYTWSKGTEEEPSATAGAKYQGEYKDGLKHGMGVFVYPDKSKYTGMWKAGKRDGRGTYVYANGDRYCGTWEGDAKKGPGTYLYKASQTQLTGTFDGNVCNDGTWEYFDGKAFTCKYKEGQVVEHGGRVIT